MQLQLKLKTRILPFFASSRNGYVLLEAIVSLGILAGGIIASLALFTSTLSFSQEKERSLVVINLAREGVEIVRSIRDNQGYAVIETQDGDWIMDSTTNYYGFLTNADNSNIVTCANCSLQLVGGRYSHDPGVATIYKRLVNVSDMGPGLCSPPDTSCEKRITSTVYWTEKGREHTFVLEAHLTAWR
jgi:Tfp pilus assembly protein PilV